jgi:hypothetical protein
MSEFRIQYQEPGLGWCDLLRPAPGGMVHTTEDAAFEQALAFREETGKAIRVLCCDAAGVRVVEWPVRFWGYFIDEAQRGGGDAAL